MKHIIKVEVLENLPETIPLIAMDANGNFICKQKLDGTKIWYTTTDEEKYDLGGIIETLVSAGGTYNGPAMISNEWDEEKQMWCMTFEGDVTLLGDADLETMTVNGPFFVTYPDYSFLVCNVKTIILPKTITRIGSYAFTGCTSLTSIEIPNSVTSIRNYAFDGCSSLTSIIIPDSVTSIGSAAFFNCYNLTSIEIPNSVTDIRGAAFRNCTSLTSVTIPNSVTSIGGSTFNGCSKLTSIVIGNRVTSIGDWAFEDCTGLTSVTCEATIPPTLGVGAFYNTNDCPIYVPSQSVDAYKTSWSDYASRIQAILSNPVSVTIDGSRISVNSNLSWLDNGYSTLYTQSTYDPGYDEQPEDFEIDTSSAYPNEGDVYYTTCVNLWEE